MINNILCTKTISLLVKVFKNYKMGLKIPCGQKCDYLKMSAGTIDSDGFPHRYRGLAAFFVFREGITDCHGLSRNVKRLHRENGIGGGH